MKDSSSPAKMHFTINADTGTDSFLHQAQYFFRLHELLNGFAEHFSGIERVDVNLKSSFGSGLDLKPRIMGTLAGRNSYAITIDFEQHPDKKGGIYIPSVTEVYQTIRHVMEREAANFREEFNKYNPSLKQRLKSIGVDMEDNKNLAANDLHGHLGSSGKRIDLEKRIWDLSEEELYLLGSSLVVTGTGGRIFTAEEITSKMEKMLEVPRA